MYLDIIPHASSEEDVSFNKNNCGVPAKQCGVRDLNYQAISMSNFISKDNEDVKNCITGGVVRRYWKDALKMESITYLDKEKYSVDSDGSMSFLDVFSSRAWGINWDDNNNHSLDASGKGSTLSWAQEVIAILHTLIPMLKDKYTLSRVRILDIGNGDMTWMSRFLQTRNDIHYTGVDIVPDIVKHHKEKYRKYGWNFEVLDSVNDPINGEYDIVICRMVIQHHFLYDAVRILKSISESDSKYVLLTTFPHETVNVELSSNDFYNPGRYRPLNVELSPIALVPPICINRDGPIEGTDEDRHYIGLWKIPLMKINPCDDPVQGSIKGIQDSVYSCTEYGSSSP